VLHIALAQMADGHESAGSFCIYYPSLYDVYSSIIVHDAV